VIQSGSDSRSRFQGARRSVPLTSPHGRHCRHCTTDECRTYKAFRDVSVELVRTTCRDGRRWKVGKWVCLGLDQAGVLPDSHHRNKSGSDDQESQGEGEGKHLDGWSRHVVSVARTARSDSYAPSLPDSGLAGFGSLWRM